MQQTEKHIKSIVEVAKLFNCNAIELNRILVKYDIPVKTEFGINDGWIEEGVYTYIITEIEKLNQSLVSVEMLRQQKAQVLPIKSGYYIYFLFDDSEIVYVGQTSALLSRIQTHLDLNKIFSYISIIEAQRKELTELEQFYIYAFNPKYNATKPDIITIIDTILKRY